MIWEISTPYSGTAGILWCVKFKSSLLSNLCSVHVGYVLWHHAQPWLAAGSLKNIECSFNIVFTDVVRDVKG